MNWKICMSPQRNLSRYPRLSDLCAVSAALFHKLRRQTGWSSTKNRQSKTARSPKMPNKKTNRAETIYLFSVSGVQKASNRVFYVLTFTMLHDCNQSFRDFSPMCGKAHKHGEKHNKWPIRKTTVATIGISTVMECRAARALTVLCRGLPVERWRNKKNFQSLSVDSVVFKSTPP